MCAHHFQRWQSLLEFRLAGRSTVRQCIDCCLVSGVMCATHVSSPVMSRSRNSLVAFIMVPLQNVNADSMRMALCSGVSWSVTHLAHNFLNNSCSVTILCNMEQEICGKWLLSSVIAKRRFCINRSSTSPIRSSVIMDGLPLHSSCTCWPAVNCLHQRHTICLFMTLDP